MWVSRVSDLSLEAIGVDPIDVGLIGTSKEVGKVLSESERTDTSPHFGSFFHFHGLDGNFGNGSIASAHKKVAIW